MQKQNEIANVKPMRNSNFELLRIISILMIIAVHMIMWHKVEPDNDVYYLLRVGFRQFGIVSVNCFILISGWFGIKFNPRKIIDLCCNTWFWTFLICAFTLCIGLHQFNFKQDFQVFLPILTRKYWFITMYIVLVCLSPYLNILIEHLTQRQFRSLVLTLLFFFVIWPTADYMLNSRTITDDSGYGLTSFIVLYFFGRYMRLYHQPHRSPILYFLGYVVFMVLCGLIQLGYSSLLGFEFTSLMSHDSVFIFFGAVMLFCCFERIQLRSAWINYLATFCFVVFIIHTNPWLAYYIFEHFYGMQYVSTSMFVFCLFVIPIVTFILCALLDIVKRVILRYAISVLPKSIRAKLQ